MNEPPKLSRRRMLTIVAGAAGASATYVAAGMSTSTQAQAAKASQKNRKISRYPEGRITLRQLRVV